MSEQEQRNWIEILSALFNTCEVSSTAVAMLLNTWDLLSAVDGENEFFSAWVLKYWPDILEINLENLTDEESSEYGIELIQTLLNTSKIRKSVAGVLCTQLLQEIVRNNSFINWFNMMWPDQDEGGDPK